MTFPDVDVSPAALVQAACDLRGTACAVSADPPLSFASSEPSARAATLVEAALGRFCSGFDQRLTRQAGALDLAAAGFAHMDEIHAHALGAVADAR